jgi:hypothetical protein
LPAALADWMASPSASCERVVNFASKGSSCAVTHVVGMCLPVPTTDELESIPLNFTWHADGLITLGAPPPR